VVTAGRAVGDIAREVVAVTGRPGQHSATSPRSLRPGIGVRPPVPRRFSGLPYPFELRRRVALMSIDDVALRPVAEDDLTVLEGFLVDPETAAPFQWFGWWDTGRWRRQWAEDGLLGGDGGHLMVVRGAQRLGFVAWRKVRPTRTTSYWSMGIGLLVEARGQGVGTEAQRQLVRYLFAHTTAVRIEADTEAENSAEQRALEKAGFTREGVMRSVVFRDGQWRDGVRYGILRGDLA